MESIWKGNDVSLAESIYGYGMVYQYNGEEFNGYAAVDYNEDGIPTLFAKFGLDNRTIDEYFDNEGDEIADMCGTTPSQMDYEWKMDALFSYYGVAEFTSSYGSKELTDKEVIKTIGNDWFGHIDVE